MAEMRSNQTRKEEKGKERKKTEKRAARTTQEEGKHANTTKERDRATEEEQGNKSRREKGTSDRGQGKEREKHPQVAAPDKKQPE